MADQTPEFESRDYLGSTDHFNGTVGTTPVSVPSVAGNIIQSVLISNTNNAFSKTILVSFDAGTNFFTIPRRGSLAAKVKGALTQIQIKGGAAGTDYEILMHREET